MSKTQGHLIWNDLEKHFFILAFFCFTKAISIHFVGKLQKQFSKFLGTFLATLIIWNFFTNSNFFRRNWWAQNLLVGLTKSLSEVLQHLEEVMSFKSTWVWTQTLIVSKMSTITSFVACSFSMVSFSKSESSLPSSERETMKNTTEVEVVIEKVQNEFK